MIKRNGMSMGYAAKPRGDVSTECEYRVVVERKKTYTGKPAIFMCATEHVAISRFKSFLSAPDSYIDIKAKHGAVVLIHWRNGLILEGEKLLEVK